MSQNIRLVDQLQRNSVALISLVSAISSLGYNTWRNEASEHNRNQRVVSIEVLRNVGELQQLVYHSHWDMEDRDKGNPLTGWALVLTIKDLSQLLEGTAPEAGTNLWKTWDDNWQALGEDRQGYEKIVVGLTEVREATNALLRSLD